MFHKDPLCRSEGAEQRRRPERNCDARVMQTGRQPGRPAPVLNNNEIKARMSPVSQTSSVGGQHTEEPQPLENDMKACDLFLSITNSL